MATKRKTRKRGGRRRNASARKATTAIAKRNPSTTVARSRSARKNPARRASRRFKNPLGGSIAGLRPMDLVGGAVGVIVDGALQLVVPAGWLGIGIRGGAAVGMVKFLPKSLGPAAGIAAGAMVVRDGVNRVFNISQLVNNQVVRLLPAAQAQQPVGMGGFVGIPADSNLFRSERAF